MKTTIMAATAAFALVLGASAAGTNVAAAAKSAAPAKYHYFGKVTDPEIEGLVKFNNRFSKALEFLKCGDDLAHLPLGEYAIEPAVNNRKSTVYAMVQEVELTPYWETQKVEVHGRYADIQMPLSGEETFGVCDYDVKTSGFAFDATKDIGFVTRKTEARTVKPGEVAIFLPGKGAHAPCTSQSGARKIKKIVVKVLCD